MSEIEMVSAGYRVGGEMILLIVIMSELLVRERVLICMRKYPPTLEMVQVGVQWLIEDITWLEVTLSWLLVQ